jgi:hypothetical protein
MLREDIPMLSKVVRVAVANNFNCTKAEFKQLDKYRAKHPTHMFFVNSNVLTRRLEAINDHPYQAVITLNPNILIQDKAFSKLYSINHDKVDFVRVRYIPDDTNIRKAITDLANKDYQVVLTLQRFNGYATLDKYTSREYYHHSCNRMRLNDDAMKVVDEIADSHKNIHICDRSGGGCSMCGLCSTLTAGTADVDLASINLSTSGICKFNCPDCYAKAMQNFLVACEKNPIAFDVIKKNRKQSGKTKHAQLARESQ